jgi:hypothetical protein
MQFIYNKIFSHEIILTYSVCKVRPGALQIYSAAMHNEALQSGRCLAFLF